MRPPKFLHRWEWRLTRRCPGKHGAPPIAWYALAAVRWAIRSVRAL